MFERLKSENSDKKSKICMIYKFFYVDLRWLLMPPGK